MPTLVQPRQYESEPECFDVAELELKNVNTRTLNLKRMFRIRLFLCLILEAGKVCEVVRCDTNHTTQIISCSVSLSIFLYISISEIPSINFFESFNS